MRTEILKPLRMVFSTKQAQPCVGWTLHSEYCISLFYLPSPLTHSRGLKTLKNLWCLHFQRRAKNCGERSCCSFLTRIVQTLQLILHSTNVNLQLFLETAEHFVARTLSISIKAVWWGLLTDASWTMETRFESRTSLKGNSIYYGK